jgi:hypothetical protein
MGYTYMLGVAVGVGGGGGIPPPPVHCHQIPGCRTLMMSMAALARPCVASVAVGSAIALRRPLFNTMRVCAAAMSAQPVVKIGAPPASAATAAAPKPKERLELKNNAIPFAEVSVIGVDGKKIGERANAWMVVCVPGRGVFVCVVLRCPPTVTTTACPAPASGCSPPLAHIVHPIHC